MLIRLHDINGIEATIDTESNSLGVIKTLMEIYKNDEKSFDIEGFIAFLNDKGYKTSLRVVSEVYLL